MDIPQLLKLLNDHHVEYIIIGATAFPVHGYTRATMDIDIFINPSKKNAENTLKALKDFGYDITDLAVEELIKNKALFRGYMVEADLHPFVKGIRDFEDVWKNRIKSFIADVPCFFASLDDLIKMKKAANRPKDKDDIKVLKELQKLKKNK